jgi:hypothetical protein
MIRREILAIQMIQLGVCLGGWVSDESGGPAQIKH